MNHPVSLKHFHLSVFFSFHPFSSSTYLLALLGAEDGLIALSVVDQDKVVPDAVVLGEGNLGHVHA